MIDYVNLDHETVYRAYPNVVSVCTGLSDSGAWDSDGNPVELDEAVLNSVAETVRMERAWQFLREKRDRLIAETDWWVIADRTATAEQLAYRQALRDLPANTADPENPIWPTKP